MKTESRVDGDTQDEDEPSVMGCGGGLAPMPTRAEAEVVWRAAYVARMVERGIHVEDARACGSAAHAVLLDDPVEAADAELEYWENDDGCVSPSKEPTT